MIAATHPLAGVRAELEELTALADVRQLGELLHGERLPALGGHEEPAEQVHQAILLQPYRPDLVERLSPLLGAFLKAKAKTNLAIRRDAAALRNGLLLAELLPRDPAVFEGVATVFEANRWQAETLGGLGDPEQVGPRLREALRWQQTDDRLIGFWQTLLESQNAEDLHDGLQGILWLPPASGEEPETATLLAEALAVFATAAAGSGEAESMIRWAVSALHEAIPRSSGHWQRVLAPQAAEWPESLKRAFKDRWPSFTPPAGKPELQIPAGAHPFWNSLTPGERSTLESAADRGETGFAKNFLLGLLMSPPRGGIRQPEWSRQYKELERFFTKSSPGLAPRPAVVADEEAEEPETHRLPQQRSRAVEGLARVDRVMADFEVQLKKGQWKRAEKFIEELVELQKSTAEPAHTAKTLARAATLYSRHGRLDLAQSALEEAIGLSPDDPVPRSGLAEILKSRGELSESERVYRETVRSFPSDVVARNGLAEILKSRGELSESERLYRETVKSFPENVVARNGLAEILKSRGELSESERLYRETVRSFPSDVVARNGLANLLRKTRRFEEAFHLLPANERLTTAQDYIDNHLRAMVFLGQGKLTEAEKLLRRGLESNPFAMERSYYSSALALVALRQADWSSALAALGGAQTSEAKVLRFHAYAGRGDVSKAHSFRQELDGKLLLFPVKKSFEAIKAGYGLDLDTPLRSPSHEQIETIFETEIEMLSFAA